MRSEREKARKIGGRKMPCIRLGESITRVADDTKTITFRSPILIRLSSTMARMGASSDEEDKVREEERERENEGARRREGELLKSIVYMALRAPMSASRPEDNVTTLGRLSRRAPVVGARGTRRNDNSVIRMRTRVNCFFHSAKPVPSR